MGEIQYRGSTGSNLVNLRALCTDALASDSERSSLLRAAYLRISVHI